MPEASPSPHELTASELQNLRRVWDGGAISDVMYRRLKALGLVQQRFGGWSVTQSGKARLAEDSEDGPRTDS
jgi:hypothetical protein